MVADLFFLSLCPPNQQADQAIEHWQKLLKQLHVDQEHMSDLAEEALLHNRIPTLDYKVDPLQDSLQDGEDDVSEEDDEGVIVSDEGEDYGDYADGDSVEEDGEDDDDEMGLDDGEDYEGESQEDEL